MYLFKRDNPVDPTIQKREDLNRRNPPVNTHVYVGRDRIGSIAVAKHSDYQKVCYIVNFLSFSKSWLKLQHNFFR